MILRYFFGRWIPLTMILRMLALLPSPHSHLFTVNEGPKVDPSAFIPWQPVQPAPPTCPTYTRLPSATISGVAPGGRDPFAAAPAFGCVPSGGLAVVSAISPAGASLLGQYVM